MHYLRILIRTALILVCCQVCTTTWGQTQTFSPYSRFGLGDLVDRDFQHLRLYGGIRGAFHDPYQANLANPASLPYITSTSFEMGAYARYSVLSEGDLRSTFWTGNLDYISLTFPIFNPVADLLNRKDRKVKWGMNVSLVPFSRVGYDTETIDSSRVDVGNLAYQFTGNGGSYKVQWANGWKYKQLSAGINAYYLFGKNQFDRSVIFLDQSNANANRFTNEYTYRGFGVDLGLIYTLKLNEALNEADNSNHPLKTLSFGFYGTPGYAFKTESLQFHRSVNVSTPTNVIDTLLFTEEPLVGNGYMPASLGAGVFYKSGDKWRMGANFEQQYWSKYRNDASEEVEGTLNDSYSMHFGIGYRPNFNSYDKFFRRLNYKAGIRFGNDPRTINGEQITTFAINTGVTAPFFFQRQVSFVDLGFELGVRNAARGIKEQYISILMGFSLNDNDWFIQRKFN